MTRISAEQAAYLTEVERARTRFDKLASQTAQARADLDALITKGHQLGISTHRLAKAALLTQPRIYQIIDAAKQAETDAMPLDEVIYPDPRQGQEFGQQP